MLYIKDDGTIQLTRGDTARFVVSITNDLTGDPYEIAPGDTLRLTIRKGVHDEAPAVQLEEMGAAAFHIRPEDTSDLTFGKYLYDVELTTADGDVFTVIEPSTFEILREVTRR